MPAPSPRPAPSGGSAPPSPAPARRRAALLALPLLAACAMPAPDLAGVEPVTVVVPPYAFEVRVKGSQADATQSGEGAPSGAALAPYALAAIERASGCRVVPTGIRADRHRVRAPLLCLSPRPGARVD